MSTHQRIAGMGLDAHLAQEVIDFIERCSFGLEEPAFEQAATQMLSLILSGIRPNHAFEDAFHALGLEPDAFKEDAFSILDFCDELGVFN